MKKTISKEQYEELSFLASINDIEYYEKLSELGIEAKSYTAYQYFDEHDNYKGNSDDTTLDELLDSMDIEVQE